MTAAFPLPRQTGHADFPHPAFAWRYCMIHSQFDQSKTVMEIFVEGYAFRALPWSLTAPSQMSGHSQPHIVVDLPISFRRIAFGEVVGPASQVPDRAGASSAWLHHTFDVGLVFGLKS